LDIWEEVEWEETFIGTAVGPASLEAELVANLKPERDLLDGCLFEIGWKGVLARAGSVAGENVAASERKTTSGWSRVNSR